MRPLDRDASWRLSLPQRAEKKSRRSETPSQRQLQPWRVERRVGKGKREEADTVQQHTCGDFQDSEIIKLQGVLVFCFGLCRWGVGAHQNRSTFFHLVYKLCTFEMEMVLCFCRCFYFLPFFVSNLQLNFHINSNFGLIFFFFYPFVLKRFPDHFSIFIPWPWSPLRDFSSWSCPWWWMAIWRMLTRRRIDN